MTEEANNDIVKKLSQKLDYVISVIDSLPTDTKEKMADKLEDLDKFKDSDDTN